jgi:hypothetical protein
MEMNDIIGIVVAWDDTTAVIRKFNRRVVKVSRNYLYVSLAAERPDPLEL